MKFPASQPSELKSSLQKTHLRLTTTEISKVDTTREKDTYMFYLKGEDQFGCLIMQESEIFLGWHRSCHVVIVRDEVLAASEVQVEIDVEERGTRRYRKALHTKVQRLLRPCTLIDMLIQAQ